jgi:hypothetical protein
LNKRQKEGFLSYTWVDNQPFEALFGAGNLDILRDIVRNLRHLGFFTDDDAGNHGRQGIQVPVEKAPGLSGVKAFDEFFDFSIDGFAVAHKASILKGIILEA